jgi:hypothetical protein
LSYSEAGIDNNSFYYADFNPSDKMLLKTCWPKHRYFRDFQTVFGQYFLSVHFVTKVVEFFTPEKKNSGCFDTHLDQLRRCGVEQEPHHFFVAGIAPAPSLTAPGPTLKYFITFLIHI